MSSTCGGGEGSDPMDITPKAQEFFDWMDRALMGIKD